MNKFSVETRYDRCDDCFLSIDKYADNDHIAIEVYSESEGPFANITVNLPQTSLYPENFGFVDVNNFPEATRVISELGIGKPTGDIAVSGFCAYPLYEFDPDAIRQYTTGDESK